MQIEEAKEYLKNYKYDNEVKEAIETVLNELEKKEAEIDKLRNTNKDLLKKLRNRVKEVKKLTRYSLYKKEFTRLNKQLEKKEKVIDLMAEWINKQDIDEEICKNNITEPELCNEEGTNCRHCIKEYFYKKVRNNGIKRK